jgi:protein phosphatase
MFGRVGESVYGFARRTLRAGMNSKDGNAKECRSAMLSHTGRVRTNNEDFCAQSRSRGVFVVCDGMGGAAAGEVASKLAAETFVRSLAGRESSGKDRGTGTTELAVQAVRAANRAVFEYSRRSPELRGMGTTLVGLAVNPAGSPEESPALTVAHVGDSRCYRFRAGELELLTEDHSLVEEQVRLGELSVAAARNHPMRNIITRAVGSHPLVEPEVRGIETANGDLYLLASDGLTRELSDEEIARILERAVKRAADGRPNLEALCHALVDEANDKGGGDNVTVLLVQVAW